MNRSYEISTNWDVFSVSFNTFGYANALNVIAANDGLSTSAFSIGFPKTSIRINNELKRRGIDYQISENFTSRGKYVLMCMLLIPSFILMTQYAEAMNLLAEDYNMRKC